MGNDIDSYIHTILIIKIISLIELFSFILRCRYTNEILTASLLKYAKLLVLYVKIRFDG